MTYILHPGYITGGVDNTIHFIDAPTLARLYGVDMKLCLIEYGMHSRKGLENKECYYHLYPRADGRYCLPIKEEL